MNAVDLRRCGVLAVVVLLAASTMRAADANQPDPNAMPTTPKEYLRAILAKPEAVAEVLTVLRPLDDNELVPLFVAYSHSADKRCRVIAVTTLGDLPGDASAAALLDRVHNDPTLAIRSQALALLMQMKKISPTQLQEIIAKDTDENLQCLATSGLLTAGQGDAALPTLVKLAGSADLPTAVLSQMRLLNLGKAEQLEPLSRIAGDPNTRPALLELMLNQIAEEKIAAAAPIAEKSTSATAPEEIRWAAYNAVAAVCPNGAQKLYDAMNATDMTVFRCRLFWLLCQQKQGEPFIKALAEGKDPVAALARFELARRSGGPDAAKAGLEVVALVHPVLASYLLDCTKDDLAAGAAKAQWCLPVLTAIVKNVPRQDGPLRQEHEQAAKAAKYIADLGTEPALAALKELLADPGDMRRATVAGLLRTTSPAAAALAGPLLDSPYEELATTAALAMGRHANRDALKSLQDIVARNASYRRSAIPILAAWFALKTSGDSKAAVADLAAAAK